MLDCRGRYSKSPLTSGVKAESQTMIACIGWGSLIWDKRDLDVDGEWRTDGPLLPVEFARQSNDGRITLVVVQGVQPVPTLWSAFNTRDLAKARESLRQRERIPRSRAGDLIAHWRAALRGILARDATQCFHRVAQRGVLQCVVLRLCPVLTCASRVLPSTPRLSRTADRHFLGKGNLEVPGFRYLLQ
jgi:hypothetical protein